MYIDFFHILRILLVYLYLYMYVIVTVIVICLLGMSLIELMNLLLFIRLANIYQFSGPFRHRHLIKQTSYNFSDIFSSK